MSTFLIAAPEVLAAASADLSGIGEAIRAARASAAPATTGIVAAAADEVSGAIARLFGNFAQDYQAMGAQATVFHERFGSALSAAAVSYSATDILNSTAVQTFLEAVNAPVYQLTGRPLVGNG